MINYDRGWGAIPPGYRARVDEGCRLIIREDQAALISARMCREKDSSDGAARFMGRERLRTVRLPGGETALIRAYRHGGLLRSITRDLYCNWPPRPFRELTITAELRRRGVPTIEVYGAAVEPLWGVFYRGWLVTRELSGAQDLWAALQSGLLYDLGPENCLRAVARSLRAMHREGVYHRDLNLKNILVRLEPEGVKGYIIDFDNAKLMLGAIPAALARRNLMRLFRSVCKLDPERKYFSPAQWADFMSFYHRGE